jgi:hypothetical protein
LEDLGYIYENKIFREFVDWFVLAQDIDNWCAVVKSSNEVSHCIQFEGRGWRWRIKKAKAQVGLVAP